jgi:hypothetical protein
MEKMHYIEAEDKLVVETIYDPTDVLAQNAAERADRPEHGKYRTSTPAGLVKVASIPEEHIVALKNIGYNLLSPDPAEVRRALVYIQQNEPHWLTVSGRPFAIHRPKWR